MTAGSAASRRVLARTPVAPLPASSPTRPTGITGRMSAPPETSSPGVCSFRLPQMCGFRLPLSLITGVDKPLTAVVGRDAVARAPCDSPQRVRRSRGDLADVLLLERPPRFNRVQVGGVRGQIQHADAVGPARRGDAGIVVGAQVVHDEHVPASKLRKQVGREPSHKADPIRGRKHRPEHDPALHADRPEQRERGAPIHRDGVEVCCAAFHPRVTPAHGQVHPRFVEKDQAFDGNPPDRGQERVALGLDVGPSRLQRPAAFVLTT